MEERSLTVLVRYCGGCNPEIDRASIVNRLKAIFEEVGMQVTFCKDPPADRLFLVNGCPRACLEEEYQVKADLTRFVSVEGSNLDHRPVPVDDLPRAVLEKIMGCVE